MSNKYYYQCDYHFITEPLRRELAHLVKTSDSFIVNITPKGVRDGNNVMKVPLESFPIIAEMVNNCKLDTVAILYKHLPKVDVHRHVDRLTSKTPRRTTLIIPLSPEKDYSPTYFWENYESIEPADVVHISDDLFPYVINTQEVHSLTNTSDEIRSNLQFCFNETLEQVVQHVKNRTLFKDVKYV